MITARIMSPISPDFPPRIWLRILGCSWRLCVGIDISLLGANFLGEESLGELCENGEDDEIEPDLGDGAGHEEFEDG